jgi:hypothetical protein
LDAGNDRLDVVRHGHDTTHRACVGNELSTFARDDDGPDENNVARVDGDVDPAGHQDGVAIEDPL